MSLIGIGVQILLGLFFTPEGVIKWTHIGPSTVRFTHFHYPQWFRYVTGVVEVLVGIGLLVGLWFPGIAALAALVLIVEMVIAMYSHLVRGKDSLLKTQDGFISRTVSKAESGEWLDILSWDSIEAAKAAAAVFQTDPAGKRFSGYLDIQHIQVFYTESVVEVTGRA